jgi:ankyrin repeat protein
MDIFTAIENNNIKAVKSLLLAGLDVTRDNYGYTALHYACWYNCVEVAKLLLTAGADINTRDSYGHTALDLACLYNCVEIAKLLISSGANINAKDSDGETALHYACRYNRVEITNLLLQHYSSAELKLMMYDDRYDNYRSIILAEIKTRS